MSKTAVQYLESIRSMCGEAVYRDLNNRLAMDCRNEATHAVRKVEALMAVLQVCADAIGKCPNCDGSGVVVYTCTAHGEPSDIGPCQWCDTYGDALSQLKAIGVEPNK